MRLIQFIEQGTHRLGVVRKDSVESITQRDPSITSIHAAFRVARLRKIRLEEFLEDILAAPAPGEALNYSELLAAGRVLAPIIDDPGARVLVSGTGLTHLGSVQKRDEMHKAAAPAGPKSHSRQMFELGLQGGRPARGQRGAAPEWFYKGDARILRGPGQPLDIPPFARDGGEEPEIVGIYAVDDHGLPFRLGFTHGNEWSDHVTESINYLYLAPSKLRTCAIGPELITDLIFDNIRGLCRVLRSGSEIYHSGELLSGEQNMTHSLANLEDHLFKFPEHRQPGDIHVHFYGTSKLSFPQRQWSYQSGDQVEVSFEGFGEPLCNPIRQQPPSDAPLQVERA
jgi:hypothetical protein